jgi:hypothetical protein
MAVSNTATSRTGPQQLANRYSDMWQVTATVDPASVATQVTGTDTITVPGVALGDHVVAFAFGVSEGNMTIRAYVSATDTVTLLYTNNTAGAIDIATSTFKCLVGRPAW